MYGYLLYANTLRDELQIEWFWKSRQYLQRIDQRNSWTKSIEFVHSSWEWVLIHDLKTLKSNLDFRVIRQNWVGKR